MTTYKWYECDNNSTTYDNVTLIPCSENIGYSPQIVIFLLVMFPLFGLISNMYLIFTFFLKKKNTRKL